MGYPAALPIFRSFRSPVPELPITDSGKKQKVIGSKRNRWSINSGIGDRFCPELV